jgi:hypothetical protein
MPLAGKEVILNQESVVYLQLTEIIILQEKFKGVDVVEFLE